MVRKLRGRPAGKSGQAPVLNPDEIKRVFKIAQSRTRFSARPEAALFISIYLGLRAKEMACPGSNLMGQIDCLEQRRISGSS